jgi:hypothetical protein
VCVDAHQILPRLVVWQVHLSRVTNFRGPNGGTGISYNGGIFLVFVKSQSKIDEPGLQLTARFDRVVYEMQNARGGGQPNVKVGRNGLSILQYGE